jgi:hypothetical protein
MKTFLVTLRNGTTQRVNADGHRLSGTQRVFDHGDAEVQFFVEAEVLGVIEEPVMKPQGVPIKSSRDITGML